MNYPEGVTAAHPAVSGADKTVVLDFRACGECGTWSDVDVHLATDGVTVYESWKCPQVWPHEGVSCEFENWREVAAEDLVDPDVEVGW